MVFSITDLLTLLCLWCYVASISHKIFLKANNLLMNAICGVWNKECAKIGICVSNATWNNLA